MGHPRDLVATRAEMLERSAPTGAEGSRAEGAVPDGRMVPALLRDLNHGGPAAIVPMVTTALAATLPVQDVRLFLVDLEEERLDRWPADPAAGAPKLVSDGHHGLAFRTGRTQLRSEGVGASAVAVVSTRRDRIGVLEVTLADEREDALPAIEDAATALGYVIASGDRWTDAFHVARRTRPMTLAAEIQWSLLPLSTFASGDIELSGALEPAYDVGGDAFDYACDDDRATIGVLDAMGHGLRAARLASLGVAAFRNARRRGEGLAGQARTIHDTVAPHFSSEGYVTGVLVEIPFPTPQRSSLVRAGHPGPIVLRGDPPTPLHLPVQGGLPFGVPFPNELTANSLELVPGDRLVLYSDGVIEARPAEGAAFGLSALADLLIATRSSSPREATRRVVRTVRDHRDADLEDDATIVIVDVADAASQTRSRG